MECNSGTIEVVGGGSCEREKIRRVEGGGCNVGTSEVVGGGGSERVKFRRFGSRSVFSLDIFGELKLSLVVDLVFGLGEESLVLLSSSNSAC